LLFQDSVHLTLKEKVGTVRVLSNSRPSFQLMIATRGLNAVAVEGDWRETRSDSLDHAKKCALFAN
jgi:hypothetical protein